MQRHSFADPVVRAYSKKASAIFESEILGLAAEDCALVDRIGGTERGKSLDHGVRANIAAATDFRILLDNRVRSDGDARA